MGGFLMRGGAGRAMFLPAPFAFPRRSPSLANSLRVLTKSLICTILLFMKKLSRGFLETLSSIELIRLADEYGIDIPDDLSRQFIIGDLIQLGEELERSENAKESIVLSDEKAMNVDTLPKTYNETKIDTVLRNPVSLFVWWDLAESLVERVTETFGALSLAVCFFEDESGEKPCGTFDIKISLEDREQYVIIPAGKKIVRVDLVCECDGRKDTLAFSRPLPLPQTPQIVSMRPGEKLDIPPVMEISGVAAALRGHYNEYRQSFY